MTAPEPLSADGSALLDEGRPVEAIEVLRQAVASGEPSAPALLLRAYFDSGSWRAVVDWLGPLVEDGDVRWAGQLGVALAGLGDVGNAEAALRLAVENGELAAANDLAILLRDERRLPEAVQVLLRATEAGDLQAPANLVELLLEDGDVPGAADVAQRYRDESRPDTLVALADVCVAQRRDEDAESLYRRAGQLGALRAHTAYGTFLLEVRGDPEGAEREFLEARRHAEPGWAYTLGRFLLDEGRGEEARPVLQIAVDSGDQAAADALAELDGVDPNDEL